MHTTVLAGADDQCSKSKIDDNGRQRKEEIQSRMTHFAVSESNQWDHPFQHPE
jgi:hypothetical protein